MADPSQRAERFVWLLRGLWVLYAAYLAQAVLAQAEGAQLAGPRLVAAWAMPVVALIVVLLGLLFTRRDIVAWALTVAGLHTMLWVEALWAGSPLLLPTLVFALVWMGACAAPRIARTLETGDSRTKFNRDDWRVVLGVLFLFGGAIVLVIFSPWLFTVAFFGGLAILAVLVLQIEGTPPWAALWPSWTVAGVLLGLGIGVLDTALTVDFVSWRAGRWFPERLNFAALGGGALHAGIHMMTIVSAVVLAPLVEELFCRGAMWHLVRQRTSGWGAVLVTGVLFALLHMGGARGFGGMPIQLIGGFALGFIRLRSESVFPCILAHALHNGALLSLAAGGTFSP